MISAELLLSTNTQWMLNSSILSIITTGPSWGCLMSQASFSKKIISSSLLHGIFNDEHHEWTLFTSLAYAFFSVLEDPPVTSPPVIILISPTGAFFPSVSYSLSFSSFYCCLYGSIFCTNFYCFLCRIRVFTWSFKCLHSLVWSPWP